MSGTGSTRDAAGDRCAVAFDRAESLLDAGKLEEALRVLQENEGELGRLAREATRAELPRSEHRLGLSASRDAAVAVAEGKGYARGRIGSAQLMELLVRTDRLLNRCEAMRDGTVEELRLLHTSSRFQPGSSVAGTWFSQEA